ncbi:hypothetical protein CC78DRAFT_584943 [Lojkania enalia]|uniref:Uncharacterized protein n=1 Tax=Lojkania enalia TaxID=147567 RepID=A0A9P4K1E0_9PLEO|nr:hypothetical protein CC78DRAFT_584943 [Didymosphaeria enalia]
MDTQVHGLGSQDGRKDNLTQSKPSFDVKSYYELLPISYVQINSTIYSRQTMKGQDQRKTFSRREIRINGERLEAKTPQADIVSRRSSLGATSLGSTPRPWPPASCCCLPVVTLCIPSRPCRSPSTLPDNAPAHVTGSTHTLLLSRLGPPFRPPETKTLKTTIRLIAGYLIRLETRIYAGSTRMAAAALLAPP